MASPLLVAVSAELVFAFSAGHMLTPAVFPDADFAAGALFGQEFDEEPGPEVLEDIFISEFVHSLCIT